MFSLQSTENPVAVRRGRRMRPSVALLFVKKNEVGVCSHFQSTLRILYSIVIYYLIHNPLLLSGKKEKG